MKKSVLISLTIFLVFSLSFSIFLHDDIFNEITGRQIFLDDTFEQEAGSFRPSKPSNSISLSPSENDCELESIYSSHSVAKIGDTVSIYIEAIDGKNCGNGNVEVKIFEKDSIFNDNIGIISGTFLRNKATIDWMIGQEFEYLFDELFEGEELEIYFKVDSNDFVLVSEKLSVSRDSTQSPLLQPSSIYLGKGCTTITYIDEDCDGYVIGGKDADPNSYTALNYPAPPTLAADANDYDSSLNTPATVLARYGSFNNINNFKNYLNDIGYTHTINNVYFISLTGNDATGQPNNINLPYATIPWLNAYATPDQHIIKPGDVVVFRGGTWTPGVLTTKAAFECIPNPGGGCITIESAVKGNSTSPILYITHPGERVIFRGQSGGSLFGPIANTSYVAIDGFEFDGRNPTTGVIEANEIFRLGGLGNHITFRRLELRNAGRWGIFGVIAKDRDYYTLDRVNIHHINGEHCIYRNDIATTGTTAEDLDTDRGWIIKNSLLNTCAYNGIHWRGGENFTFENNIIHTTGLNGIDMKNSPQNGTIKNNLIFNNGHGPILIFEDNDPQRFGANGAENLLITQNILVGKNGLNGAGGDNSAFSALRFTHFTDPPRTNRDIKVYNNILYTNGPTPIRFEHSPDIAETTVRNNIFYRAGFTLPNDASGMSVCGWTDGTHNSVQNLGCYGILDLYVWNFDSMQNPTLRPNINGNLLANPLFIDVTNTYTTSFTPWLFNFLPTSLSPSIDFTNPTYSTSYDMRGSTRIGPSDTGAYEYGAGSIPPPALVSITPSTISSGLTTLLNFNGFNFDFPGAFLQVCSGGVNCVDLSSGSFNVINSQLIQYEVNLPFGNYLYRIRNVANVYSSILSLQVTQAPPSAPNGLTVTVPGLPQGLTQLNLNWVDTSSNEDNFVIERRQLPSGSFALVGTVGADVTSFSSTGLSVGTSYEYRVYANNVAGVSGFSNVASGTTLLTIPVAPSNLVTTALSTNTIRLDWQDNSDNEYSFIVGRRAHLIGGPNAWINITRPANMNTYTDTPLTINRIYEYRVLANNTAGSSAWSTSSFSTTFECNPGQTMSCPNQNGICAGSQQICNSTGNWPGCTAIDYELNNVAYNVNEIGLCLDGIDNDCDVSGEFDYAGAGLIRGDNDCPVGVTAINSPSNAGISSPFTLSCTSTVPNVRSIQGLVDSNLCSFVNWQGNNANFNCVEPVSGVHTTRCNINLAYSYQSGTNQNQLINIGGACSGYGSSVACEGDNACDWCEDCIGVFSSGGADRCVDVGSCPNSPTPNSVYMCRSTGAVTCGATCDNTVNGCSADETCNLNSCGCDIQTPSIDFVVPTSSSWGIGNTITINGQYFANNAELLVNGDLINPIRLTRGVNTLSFTRNSEEFNVGQNSFVVRNPISGLVSNEFNISLNSNPSIGSIVPSVIFNDVLNVINITGLDFDPLSKVMLFDVIDLTSLTTYVNSGLIQLNITPGLPGSDLIISVLSGDSLVSSNSQNIRINYPFDHFLILNASVVSFSPTDSFESIARLETNFYMVQENLILEATTVNGISVTFLGPTTCTPDILALPHPFCEVPFRINTQDVAPGQYNITFISNSSDTFLAKQEIITLDVIASIQPPSGSGGSSGSGGGSSGGSSNVIRTVLQQCDDNKDNDNDGLIDYPEDFGCSSVNDNSEFDSSELVESNYTFGEENPETLEGNSKDIEIRLVFWLVLSILIAGITIVVVLLIRIMRVNSNFVPLSKFNTNYVK